MKLVDLLPKSMIVLDLKAKDKKGAIRELIQRLVTEGRIKDDDGRKVEKAVNKRESQGSTGIGKGLAIPHAKDCSHIHQILGVFARSVNGVSFEAVDGGLVHLIFLVVSPENHAEEHLSIMRKIATLHRDEKTLKFLITTNSVDSIVEIFKEVDDNFR
jgi:mannitol/fructose-specific phosphotransferase system IIA component (Ntr-type)